MRPAIRRLICGLLIPALACLGIPSAHADLAAPVWYDQNAVNTSPDWHYRVPINVPGGASVNSTIRVDVDFAALLAQLGIAGTFDVNSPRIVTSGNALAATQEYTDTVYAGATDATGNARGEVRFLLQNAGPVTYYLYFDITANGAKPANPQTPINGNFEVGSTGLAAPAGWIAPTKANAAFDAQIRPSETVSVTTDNTGFLERLLQPLFGAPVVGPNPRNTNGTPNTGAYSYMIGARTNNEPATAINAVAFTRSITVPTTTPGTLSLRYRPEGWDSARNSQTEYDYITIQVVGGATTTLVGPVLANYTTQPYSPNLGEPSANASRSGFSQYNGYDCDTNGTHRSGMTVGCNSEPWFTASLNLAAYAGQTVTLSITSSHTLRFKTWFHIDDVEWSVVNATLGTPQGYGVNITAPTGATIHMGGENIVITALMDAQPTAAGNPVTADIYDQGGSLVSGGVILYNDGSHGDAVANNAVWSNNGSVPAQPTYQVPGGVLSGSGWRVRVYARDASTSTIGATNGLVHIPAQPNTPLVQANFYNIDEQTFTVNTAFLTHLKTVAVTSDPVNGGTNPKNIPGAEVLYTLNVTNSGAGPVSNNTLVIVDPVPANTELFTGNLSGGAPYVFIDGTPSSALSCAFIALNNFADCIDFSGDGGATWTFVPNGAFDPAVTHFRFTLSGTMNADAIPGSPSPNVSLQFRVRIK